MPTFATLKTRVLRRVIDAPSAVSTEVGDLINEAIRTLETDHNFKIMEALSGPHTTAAATRALVTRPSNWKEARGRPWYVTSAEGHRVRMQWAPNREAIQGIWDTTDTGAPTHLLEAEASDDDGTVSVEVWPLSDANSDYVGGQYRVMIPYWKFLPDLSADGDDNWFTNNAWEYIIHTAVGQAFALDWDEQRMALWTQTGETHKRRAIKRDKLAKLAMTNTLVPYWQGANSPIEGEA